MAKKIKTKIPVKSVFKIAEPVKLRSGSSLCLSCRGSKLLCGKSSCPVLVRIYSFNKVASLLLEEQISGASPPDVFVGWKGYPHVNAGPLIPPETDDTSLLANPSVWLGLSIAEIAEMRIRLVRGSFKTHVKRPWDAGKLYYETLETALSSRPAYVDAVLSGKPRAEVLLDSEVQPMGPLAPVKDLSVSGVRGDRKLEKVFYDHDLKTTNALKYLYESKVSTYSMVRVLSVGGTGLQKDRRLVPTRWSITAVDDIVSKYLRDHYVKRNPLINEYRVYEYTKLGNRFIILMIPEPWQYESIEAWFPGTLWNPDVNNIAMIGDWEGYWGRKDYASMGGCYYAARFSVAEKLKEEGRQASVLVLREIYKDYIMPLGVWLVREMVRKALSQKPLKFTSLTEALNYVFSRLKIPRNAWINNSVILSGIGKQTSMVDFL